MGKLLIYTQMEETILNSYWLPIAHLVGDFEI